MHDEQRSDLVDCLLVFCLILAVLEISLQPVNAGSNEPRDGGALPDIAWRTVAGRRWLDRPIFQTGPEVDAAIVAIDPPVVTVGRGLPFTVAVVVTGAQNLAAFQFDLRYDAAVLQAIGVDPGPLLGSSGRSIAVLGPQIDNNSGRTRFGVFTYGEQPSVNDDGVLAVVTMTAKSLATGALLSLESIRLSNVSGEMLPALALGGTVTVMEWTPTATPTATVTPSQTPTVTGTTTRTPTATPTVTPTLTSTVTPTLNATGTATSSPTPTDTPCQTVTATVTPTPTGTWTPEWQHVYLPIVIRR